jgi:outer membrane protein assembly factor BamD (BamD/ComL family)
LAAKFAPSDSKKTSTFGKLVKIAELNLDKERASIFLEKLGEVAPDKIRIDSKMKWIVYQRELGNYDEIINQIESMLGLSEFAPEYMQLELELGKVYKEKGDISIAKEIFSVMVDNYSKKNETAEAYYHLGFMALIEDFNLDLAKEYFEKSKTEKSQSKYGKESREFLNKISRFEDLQSLYKELIKNPDEDVEIDRSDFEYEDDDTELKNEIPNNEDRDAQFNDANSSNQEKYNDLRGQRTFDMSEMQDGTEFMNPNSNKLGTASASSDSVLFMIGEMLLYDFNRLELSLEKFKTLVVEYPESNFAPQAFYVLSHFEPESNWQMQLETSFPNSSFLNTNSTLTDTSHATLIEVHRDHAWSLAKNSYEESYNEFNRLFKDELDTLAGYISGFISDYYLNDIELAVTHYQSFTDSFPNHSYAPIIETRLLEIKTDIEDQKEISQQGIDYQAAVMYLHNDHNYDSVKVLLTNITSGLSSPYKDAANNLKSVIRDYNELSEEIMDLNVPSEVDTVIVKLEMPLQNEESFVDSLYFLLAELFAHDLEFMDSAKFYHKKLINAYGDSKFRPLSILFLSEIEPEGQWGDLLNIEYPDLSYNPDSTIHHSVYIQDIFQEDFAAIHENNIALCDIYSEYFLEPEAEEPLIEDSGEPRDEKEIPEEVLEKKEFKEPIVDVPDEPVEDSETEEFLIEEPRGVDEEKEISEEVLDEKEFKEPIVDVPDEPVEDSATEELLIEESGETDEEKEIFFEPFTELNGNNNWDPAENFTDDNQNGIWDAAEPFIDLGNGKYDSGEKFVDLYSNGKWDAQLWYVDKNSNNKWDDGEPFEDLNKDGRRSYGEPYTDKNNNKLYDSPEQIDNIKFNYSAVLFSEPFTDESNGNYDLGESFQDNNGDGIWTPAEEFEDTNGDGVWTPAEEFEDLNGNKMWDAINPKSVKPDSIISPADSILHPGNEKEIMKP